MAETYNFGVTDLNGKPVPDSKLSPVFRDTILSSQDYDASCKNGVRAYSYDDVCMPLADVDLDKYIVKYIAGLWRMRTKPVKTYTITNVYDKRFVLGPEIKINERDEFNFKYYYAALEKYDLFGVLEPTFDWYVARCNTKKGRMMRYGETREEARAFLRGAIMDAFAPNIASFVLADKKTK
ncbi:MAG: hypothetical protein IKP24_00775 [Alphaproteobacteria bacterium]|nr:hypothetical protein [Alphaproteobacteria bacterium]